MRRWLAITCASGVLLVSPICVCAQAVAVAAAQPSIVDGTSQMTHATRGVVKTIDATTLVLSRPKDLGEMTFKLSPSVQKQGTVVVGATVSVRYHEEGKVHVALAISVQRVG